MDVVAVVSGIVAIIAAVVSWWGSSRAQREREIAEAAASRARELVRHFNTQRLLGDGIYRCRVLITAPDWSAAREHVLELHGLISRLWRDPAAQKLGMSRWWRAPEELRALESTLKDLGDRPLIGPAKQEAVGVVLRVLSKLEDMSAEGGAKIGVEDGRSKQIPSDR